MSLRRLAWITGLAVALMTASPAWAGQFTVTSPNDTADPGTLRWAIGQANSSPDATDTIDFTPGLTTITMTASIPTISAPGITIDGCLHAPGPPPCVTITTGTAGVQGFDLDPAADGTVLEGLRITGMTVGINVRGADGVRVAGIQVDSSAGAGIALASVGADGATDNEVGPTADAPVVLNANGLGGVRIEGAASLANRIVHVRGTSASQPLIDIVGADPQGGVQPPEIVSAATRAIAGRARPGATIHVYTRSTDQSVLGHVEAGVVIADAGGVWVARPATELTAGTTVAATQTPPSGTSELSAPAVAATDTTPPQTTFPTPPPAATNDTTPNVAFEASEFASSFECSIDAGAFAPCASPFTAPPLTAGAHTIAVRATDPAGNTDPSPAGASIVVDLTAPTVLFTEAPGDATNDPRPRVSFAAGEPGVSFTCRVDGGAATPCTAPLTLGPLDNGGHVLVVQGVDPAGNAGPPTALQIVIDTVAPDTRMVGPTKAVVGRGGTAAPAFSVLATESGATFGCRVDGGTAVACGALFAPSLRLGRHVVEATAHDAAGNVDPTPARRTVLVTRAPRLPRPVRIASGTANLRGGALRVALACTGPGSGRCSGILTVRPVDRRTPGALPPLARLRYTVASGRRVSVPVRLGRRAQRTLCALGGRIDVEAAARDRRLEGPVRRRRLSVRPRRAGC
jgi:hypothetical protein